MGGKILGWDPEAGRMSRLVQSLPLFFPHPDITYGKEFREVGDERTILGECTFMWLVSIKPSYLVYRCGDDLEPYLPCRFARQFGYDELYIGNPNPRLRCMEV